MNNIERQKGIRVKRLRCRYMSIAFRSTMIATKPLAVLLDGSATLSKCSEILIKALCNASSASNGFFRISSAILSIYAR